MTELSVSDIPRRKPILDIESSANFPKETIIHQWQLMTELIKREIQANPDSRQAVLSFIAAPVSESLANQVVTAAADVSEHVSKLQDRFKQSLGRYLSLPAVPDELITPDIRSAPAYGDPESYIASLEKYSPESFQKAIRQAINSGRYLPGITGEERKLIATRYQMGRDCKILSLAAELLGISPLELKDTETPLPSGTRIYIDLQATLDHKILINPLNWVKRRMIKDRVFEVDIAGKQFILKEMKTPRHTDTHEYGFRQGLSSGEEFKTAAFFQEHGRSDKEGIVVNWEKPLAYVVFPDGYQFTIFAHEKGLMNDEETGRLLTQALHAKKADFQEEYNRIAQRVKDLKQLVGNYYPELEENLSFEAFARIKADYWIQQARNALSAIITQQNYGNYDLDGYAFKIHNVETGLKVEILGIDFENFYKIDPSLAQEITNRRMEFELEKIQKNLLLMPDWDDNQPVSKIERAGHLALFEEQFKINLLSINLPPNN